eukprot:15157446-Ditylum_brightwellii.AAC.1
MQLHVNSDAAYLVMSAAKSCIAGYFFLSADSNPLDYNNAPHNAPILVKFCALQKSSAQLQRQSAAGSSTTHRMQSL